MADRQAKLSIFVQQVVKVLCNQIIDLGLNIS
jgi:hypothetical protein